MYKTSKKGNGGVVKEEVYEKFATKALAYIENTESFLKEQIPDYFQQLVTYYAIQSTVYAVLSFAGLCVCAFFFHRYSTMKEKNYYSDEKFVGCLFSSVFGVLFAILVICNTSTALKAIYAPKVFIVDHLRGK
jgi:hypothetical protein